MRLLTLLLIIVAFSTLALGQAVIVSGHTANSAYGVPYVPRVTTPTYSFGTPALQVGARNATEGNVAGATNATVPTASPFTTEFIRPVWYGQTAVVEPETADSASRGLWGKRRGFEFGAASSQSEGLAVLIASTGPVKRASRVYTNQDVERTNDTNGLVKYRGKTEHWQ